MERTGITLLLLGISCFIVAGWAWAAALGDSNDEIATDFQNITERNRK